MLNRRLLVLFLVVVLTIPLLLLFHIPDLDSGYYTSGRRPRQPLKPAKDTRPEVGWIIMYGCSVSTPWPQLNTKELVMQELDRLESIAHFQDDTITHHPRLTGGAGEATLHSVGSGDGSIATPSTGRRPPITGGNHSRAI